MIQKIRDSVRNDAWNQVGRQADIRVIRPVTRQVGFPVQREAQEIGDLVIGQVRDQASCLVKGQVLNQVRDQMVRQVLTHTLDQVSEWVRDQVRDQAFARVVRVGNQVGEQVYARVGEWLKEMT